MYIIASLIFFLPLLLLEIVFYISDNQDLTNTPEK